MITKINFKGKYKQFKNTETPHALKKYNLFYGMNGTGKSTISRLFYILEEYQKNPNFNINDDKYNEIQNAQLTYNDSIIDWNNLDGFYQDNHVSVRVFNQDYIRRTMNTQVNTECEAIFVLGQENQILIDELATLQNEKQDFETQKQTKIESKNKDIEPKFDLSNHASNIRTTLNKLTNPTELIRSSDLRSDHLKSHLEQRKCNILTDQQKDSYIKVIKNNNAYTKLNAPKIEMDINSLIHDTIIILKQTVESQTIERLEQNQQLKKWVREGYSQFSKDDTGTLMDTCPFCEQQVTQNFWNTLSNAFTDQQAEFTKQIQALINKISEKKTALSNLQIIDSSHVYPTITNTVDTIQNFQTAISNISSILYELLVKLKEKKDLLNVSIEIDIQYDTVNKQLINEYTSMIASHNEEIKNSIENFNNAKDHLLNHEIATLQSIYDTYIIDKSKYDTKVSNINQEINTIDSNIQTKNTEITNKQQEIKRQNTNIEQINNALHKYMGHKSVKFIVAGTENNITFKLVRLDENDNIIANNEPVFLSEGETTLAAFTYFIHQLESRDLDIQEEQKSNYIIVIDDPITSMDSNFVFFITQNIKKIIDNDCNTIQNKLYNINQVIFLTHHYMFFREIWSIFYTSFSNQASKYKNNFSYFLLQRNNTNLSIGKIPELYTKHQSEYFYLFQQIYRISNSRDTHNDDYTIKYHAPNISRKLLEHFTLFKYGIKEIANLKDKINSENIDQRNPQERIEWDSIYRYVNEFSHNLVIHEERDFTHLNHTESPQLIMNLIKHLDKEHYDAMVGLICNNN